ncbi:MAG: hypothetical protein EA367_07700 [Leptolyngbya sp. DLM2.Bin15]|nr:MAG: hypothetical protein EA367_07700 [Leptolyngbya sp. DLM2.Bin15]
MRCPTTILLITSNVLVESLASKPGLNTATALTLQTFPAAKWLVALIQVISDLSDPPAGEMGGAIAYLVDESY